MMPQVNTIVSDFAFMACGDNLHVNTMYVNKWQQTVTAAFLEDDLASHLFTLLWPLVVIWVYKVVDRCRVGQRLLCRSQINTKIARVSQTIDGKGR